MRTRKAYIAALTAGAFAVGLYAAVLPAAAEKRSLTVTLLGGSQVNITVDVPPGTPVDAIKLPAFNTPVIGVSDNGPVGEPEPPPPPPDTGPSSPTGPTGGSGKGNGNDEPKGSDKPKPTGSKSQGPTVVHKKQGSGQSTQGHAGTPEVTDSPTINRAKRKHGKAKLRDTGGAPTADNPTFSFALPGPAPIGVPNFFIDRFRIPPFLLPIYQAAGVEYDVPWQILAAINEIESDYGRNLSVSSAGAVGWMQFLPSTWKLYGVDANADGRKDPYNPVDAIFGAARYLKAAGAAKDVKKAIFAYNHADWYVQSVMLRAKLIGGLPADLVGSLTGLTQGHFPVAAKASYADDINERHATKRVKGGNAAIPVDGSPNRRAISIFAKDRSPVIAVNDGRIVRMGTDKKLGKFVTLQDVYGNTYTYAQLGSLAKTYGVPKEAAAKATTIKGGKPATAEAEVAKTAKSAKKPKTDKAPTIAASAGRQASSTTLKVKKSVKVAKKGGKKPAARNAVATAPVAAAAAPAKERLFAHPTRNNAYKAGGKRQIETGGASSAVVTFKNYFSQALSTTGANIVQKPLKPGATVQAGTILGRIGKVTSKDPHVQFSIRPAGRGAPRIDPKPILDGWKLLESTAIYRAAGKNPFFGPDAKDPSIGQILLMSKEALQRRVLSDPRVSIYECGQKDIKAGIIDRRILATLEFLVASGLNPTVTSLHCGHGYLTASGNVSEHSTGDAVDIAKVNGIPIAGHQGAGTITDITIRRLLTLQGTMKPHQIISLMTFKGADNTMALADHYDHIHVGFHPAFGADSKLGKQVNAVLKPGQWIKLIQRLKQIPNPKVPIKPSKYAIKAKGRDGAD